jgi:hypothetical protein
MLIGAWRRENETRVWPSLRGALATKQTTLCLRHGRATLSVVIARLDRATQYSEAFLIRSKGRGILDPPHARGMTVFCGAARCVYLVAWIASRSARNDVIDCLTNAPRFTVIARSPLVRRSPPSGEGGCDEANHSLLAAWTRHALSRHRPARPGDPVFRGVPDQVERSRHTGSPACAGDDGFWWSRAVRLPCGMDCFAKCSQ